MYTLFVKDNSPRIDILIIRAMLALAGIIAIVYRNSNVSYLSFVCAFLLLITAVLINRLLEKLGNRKLLLVSISAAFLFIATRSIAFAAILLCYGWLAGFLYRRPVVVVLANGIRIKKSLVNTLYPWNDFSNIILKDGLLTLDFKNNKLLQLVLDEKTDIGEHRFNEFCKAYVTPKHYLPEEQ